MRIRHSVTLFFGRLVVPSLCAAMIGYFSWYAFHGPRGLKELGVVEGQLSIRKTELAELTARRDRLAHRVHLLEPGSVDPDMVEEVARTQLMEGRPGELAVPRSIH